MIYVIIYSAVYTWYVVYSQPLCRCILKPLWVLRLVRGGRRWPERAVWRCWDPLVQTRRLPNPKWLWQRWFLGKMYRLITYIYIYSINDSILLVCGQRDWSKGDRVGWMKYKSAAGCMKTELNLVGDYILLLMRSREDMGLEYLP